MQMTEVQHAAFRSDPVRSLGQALWPTRRRASESQVEHNQGTVRQTVACKRTTDYCLGILFPEKGIIVWSLRQETCVLVVERSLDPTAVCVHAGTPE